MWSRFFRKRSIIFCFDKLISLSIVILVIINALSGLSVESNSFNIDFIPYTVVSIFRHLLSIVGIICFIYRGVSIKYFLFLLPLLFLFFISLSIHPDNEQLNLTTGVFIRNIALVFYFITIQNFEWLYKYMLKASVAYFVFLLCFILYITINGFLHTYSFLINYMHYAYSMLPFILIHIYDIYRRNNIISILIFLFYFSTICVCGCRGAIVCALFYIIILFARYCIMNKKYFKLARSICFFIAFLFFVLFSIKDIYYFLNENGIDSHVITKLATAQDFRSVTSSRSLFYTKILDKLEMNPCEFNGINANYTLLGIYCHNIILELLYDFGGLFGSIIIVLLFLLTLKTLVSPSNTVKTEMTIYFFVISGVKLLFSFSLYNDLWLLFWFMLLISSPQKTRYANKC